MFRTALVLVFLAAASSACATAVKPLPDDFHWGVATSGFQSEGFAPDSNWSRYAAREGTPHRPYRNSVDFFHRADEDIALAASLGINTFRFSIEWARVMPKRGVIDEDALRFYDHVFDLLERHQLVPMVTLLHFVIPGWVVDEGGLAGPGVVDAFSDFVKLVATRYRSRHAWWVTLNEAAWFLQLERRNGGVREDQVELAKEHLVQLHVRAFDVLHTVDPGSPVTTNVVWEPAPASWFDDWFFERVKDRLDYLGVDFYYSVSLDLSAMHALRGEYWKVKFTPAALLTALKDLHARAPTLPLYVVENGMATDDGLPRPEGYLRSEHLRDHVYFLQRARDEGLDVVGYNVWSLTDNYEWGEYRSRFGLFTVDVERDPSLRRKPTEAVDAYRRLIRERGVPADFRPKR